jgi:hypothetical protein
MDAMVNGEQMGHRLRRLLLYPLSYGAVASTLGIKRRRLGCSAEAIRFPLRP